MRTALLVVLASALVLAFACVCAHAASSSSSLVDNTLSRDHPDTDEALELLSSVRVRESFSLLQRMYYASQGGDTLSTNNGGAGVGDYSFKCALCGIAVNEVEGFLVENRTEQFIKDALRKGVCAHLGGGALEGVCDVLVEMLPGLLLHVENRWEVSKVCVEELHMCEKPFPKYPDNQPVPSYDVNMDLPPAQRWQSVCSQPQYGKAWQLMINTLAGVLPTVAADMDKIGSVLHSVLPSDIREEISGCASQMGVSDGWTTLLNVGYEVSDACTSIVAALEDGTVLHGRNLDFWAGMGFTNTLKELAFEANIMKGGKLLYKTTTFAGYVGVLSGMKAGAFSVTLDTRFYPEGPLEMLKEIIVAIRDRGAQMVALLTRKALEQATSYSQAMQMLSNEEVIADVYYIVAGAGPNEGAVISRNRTAPDDVWSLAPSEGRWFVLETNYDHWKPAPWFDDRRNPGNQYMRQMGRQDMTLDGIYNVLSTKPVFNLQTTYTILAVPSNGTYVSKTRYCTYPCTQ